MNPLLLSLLVLAPATLLVVLGHWPLWPAAALGLASLCLILIQRSRQVHGALLRQRRRMGESPEASPWWTTSARESVELVDALGRQAEEGRFARATANLRWVGLTELWTSLSRSESPRRLEEKILRFVRDESGFPGAALLRLEAESREISGTWCGEATRHRCEPVRWATEGVSGAVLRCLERRRPVHSEKQGASPLLRVNRSRPAVVRPDEPYLIMPLRGPAQVARGGGEVLGVLVFLGRREPAEALSSAARRLEPVVALVGSLLEHLDLHRRLVAAERLREGMLDAMLNGLVGTDPRGRVIFANRRARELAGDPDWMGEALGDHLLLPSRDAIPRALVEGIAYSHADARLRRRGGNARGAGVREVPVRVSLTPLAPEEGGRRGIVCVLEDRSQIQALEDEVRHLDTLAAIGRFASSLAHEIRNPLGGIRAGIGYLGRGAGLDPDLRETIEVIDNDISRLDQILENLLSVARPQPVAPRACDAEELVLRARRSFEALARERGVELRFEKESAPGELQVDGDMIHQVLINLIKNALEASPRGGAVRLVLAGPAESEAWGMQVRVEDQGPGIESEDLAKLFEPFFSRKSGGTGLGLYVCHNFVQRHGGRLWAENIAEGGARFVLELPGAPALIGG